MKLPIFLTGMLLCIGHLSARAQTPVPPSLIDVKVTGSATGRPVVLIPGLATPGTIWDDTVAKIGKDHPCYVVTLAGFGGKSPVKTEHFLADVRDQLIADLRARKLDKPVIVGHSLGGVVTLDLASKAPDLPGSLVIVDSLPFLAALMIPGIETEAQTQQAAAGFRAQLAAQSQEQFAQGQKFIIATMVTSPENVTKISALTGKSDPATTGQAMAELLSHDLRPQLGAIKCPVLVLGALAGRNDTDKAREAYRAQYKNLPQASFEFFDKSKHFIMFDDPAGFDAALQKGLDAR